MTQFRKEDLPADIDSVEKVAVWAMEVLQNLYPEETVIEFLDENGEPLPRRTVEANKFFYTSTTPAKWRHAARLSVEISKDHQVSGHVWDHVKPIGDLAIPNGMKVA